jgi:hypothetical protein
VGGNKTTPTFASVYPDLDALDDDGNAPFATKGQHSAVEGIRAERMKCLATVSAEKDDDDAMIDWFLALEGDVASAFLDRYRAYDDDYDFASSASSSNDRFQSQLLADEWNLRVMTNEDKLLPRE